MADVWPLGIYFLVTFMMLVSHVHLLVPPKTPVLSGFEPAAIGSYRELVCDADQPGAGTITYKWYKYSRDTRTGVETWESKGPIGTSQKYIFNPVTEKHVFHQGGNPEYVSGKYMCRASNSAGTTDSQWGDLYVYKPCSLYTASVSPSKPTVGSTFTVNCNIPNPSGFTVTWTKRSAGSSGVNEVARANSLGCRTPPISRYSWSACSLASSTSRTFNVQVTNAQTSDFGYWICTDAGLSCGSKPVKIEFQDPPGKPQITGFPSGPVLVGTQLNLKCVASPPGDTYDWYKDNTKLTTSSSYDFQVKKESAGVYKCVARNAGGSATSSDKTLAVYYKPDSVVVSSGKTSSHVGEKDKFTCTATGGKPTPTLKIYFKRSRGTPVEVTQGQERLMAKEDNQAEYYCEATVPGYPVWTMRSSTKTYSVTFANTKVFFTNKPTAAVQVGQDKTFRCETDESNPITSIKWYWRMRSSLWRDITTGISSSERNGAYGGKIRISDVSITATKAMNGVTVRCTSKYGLTGHEFATAVDTKMNVKWSATELKMVNKPNTPITAGGSVSIKCETDSSNSGSPGTISWYRNNQQITSGVTTHTRQASDGGTIYISQLTFTARKEDNQAKYECKINDQTSWKKDVIITVYFPPDDIQLSETSITVREGESKTITCRTTSSSNPATSVSVKKKLGSTEVDVTGSPSETNGANSGKDVSVDIKLDTNRKDNDAQYICTFSYASTTTFRKTATVNVLWSATELEMVNRPNTPITAGGSVSIKCETDSSNSGSPGTISWYRNNQQITSGVTPDTRQASGGGTIYISQLTFTARKEDNQAKYECKINDQTSWKKDVTIAVYYPPSASLSTNPKTVKEGDDVTLTCEASGGNPTTYSYSWYYNNKEIQNEKSRTYAVKGVKYTQTGPYRCQVVNYSPGGVADATKNIDILYKAKWNPDFQKVLTVFPKPSESVRFVLRMIANPPPTNVSWLDQYNRLATDQGFSTGKANDTTYTLSKQAVSLNDYGEYSAKVMNDVGTSVFTFEIMKRVASNTTLTYVKRHGTRMTARWVALRRSYTTLRINYCRLDNLDTCSYHLVMNQTAGDTSFEIEGSAMVKSVLGLYLEVFDGRDLVFRSKPVTESKEGGTYIWVEDGPRGGGGGGTNVGMIVGIVIMILVVEAVIVAVVILHRRNMACFSGSKKGQTGPALSSSAAKKMEPMYANINPAFEAGGNPGTTRGENEARDLHLGNKEPVYINVTSADKGDYAEPYDLKESPYAQLNITADVIAEQTYSDLRHKGVKETVSPYEL